MVKWFQYANVYCLERRASLGKSIEVRQRHKKHNCHADLTISEAYEATCRKTNHIRQAGYKVVEKWEHDFEVDEKNNPAVI